MVDSIIQDLRFAVRSLRKRPLFLLIPVLSLTIGIGANTTIFSIVNRFLLKGAEGVSNASRVVELGRGRDGAGFDSFSYPDFLDLRQQAEPLEALAGMEARIITLSRGDAGERALGMLVSANFFDVLGVHAASGRTFLPEEDEGVDEHPVVVLSHQFWASRWGADPDILGSTVYLSRKPYTVVGVLPEEFRGHMAVANPDAYVPMMQHPSLNEGRNQFENRGSSRFQVLGLLKGGATVQEADAAVMTVMERLQEEYPETNARRTAAVRPYGALPSAIRGPAGMFLAVLTAFVGLILLITCANVASMFLARAMGRRKEIAIRLSLGSDRAHLIRHLLSESLLVFFLGGIGGMFLAGWSLSWLASLDLPTPVPLALRLDPDTSVFLFSGLVTLLTGLVFGLLPARQALKLDLLGSLKDEGGRAGSSESRLRKGFVAAQVAASLVLLVAAGLLLRTLQHAGAIATGFQAEGAYLTFVDLTAEGYETEDGAAFQEELLGHFSSLPWVESVALSLDLPLDLSSRSTIVEPEGWETGSEGGSFGSGFNSVSPAYFEALRIPVVEGRAFDQRDRKGNEPVAIVSRAYVDRAWPGETALGKQVFWGGREGGALTVVGVVEDVQNRMLTDSPEPFVYRPLAQYYGAQANLVVRSSVDQASVTREFHRGLRDLDSNLSLSPVIDLQGFTAAGILPQRIAAFLASGLGLLALLLSGMGVYGMMAQSVARRTRELGIRVALGAEPARVLREVLVGAFRLALPGLAIGAFVAVGVGVLLRSLLLGVSLLDPVALGGVALTVAGMVLAGTAVPARRAARVDPADALRYD